MNDDLIRRAVAELVDAAPTPKPLPDRTVTSPNPGDRYRWMAIAAAAVLLVGGVVAVAAWQRRDSGDTSDSLPPAPITTAPITPVPVTSVTPTTPGTVATIPPSTAPAAPPTSPTPTPDEQLSTAPGQPLPSGTLEFGQDDVVATRVDGDLWWYPGLLGDNPGEPVRLLDLPDPREQVAEGPGPNVVTSVAGAVNGTLIYSDCCEPAAGQVLTLGAPDAEPALYNFGDRPALSPDGTKLATVGMALIVTDFAAGEISSIQPTALGGLVQLNSVVWSPDGSKLAVTGGDGTRTFVQIRASQAPFEIIAEAALDQIAGNALWPVVTGWTAGDEPSIELEVFDEVGVVVDRIPFDPTDLEVLEDTVGAPPTGATSHHVDADGRQLWVADNALLADTDPLSGELRQLLTGIGDAWFVPTHAIATPPPDPAATALTDYFSALAEGRYADGAQLLGEGGLEYERRTDLRPLFSEFGDTSDLATRLQQWCETVALCAQPTDVRADGGYTVATFQDQNGIVSGYYRSGTFEGAASVSGLAPRRPRAGSQPCSVAGVITTAEADLDGDEQAELVVITIVDHVAWVHVCNTATSFQSWRFGTVGESLVLAVVDDLGDGRDELLIGEGSPDSLTLSRLELVDGALQAPGVDYQLAYPPLPTSTPTTWSSFGCADIDGVQRLVQYRYELIGGDTPDTARSADVTTSLAETGTVVDTTTYPLPDQLDTVVRIVDPHCGDLSILTEG